MQTSLPYTITLRSGFEEASLRKGVFIVIMHAHRVPPHIGIIAGNAYHSLTIKGRETDVPLEAFLKNIRIRRIACVFIKVKDHPVYSNDFLREHIAADISLFPKVTAGEITCLSPVKVFFEAAYGIPIKDAGYIFELLPVLEERGMIEYAVALNAKGSTLQLPVYDQSLIDKEILSAENEARKIKKQ